MRQLARLCAGVLARPAAAIAVATLALLAAIWAAAFAFSAQERAFAVRMAEQTTAALASAYREHISNMLERVDDLLLRAKADFEANPATFDFGRWAEASPNLNRLATQFGIVDRHGTIVASSQGSAAVGIDIADREHFQVHVERDSDVMHVSKPVFGRTTGKFSIQITRRLNAADGSFAGVLVFSLDAGYLAKVYGEGQIGRSGMTALIGFDGIVRVRAVGGRTEIGVAVRDVSLFRTFLASPDGRAAGVRESDGDERVVSWEHVDAHPLLVAVSASLPEMIDQYARAGRYVIAAAGLVTFLVALLAFRLLRAYRSLRLEVEQRQLAETALVDARDQALAANRAKSSFLANMSHELRTPLNAIIGFAEMIAKEVFGPAGSERYREYASDIKRSGEHLLGIVNDLLDLSRIEAGALRPTLAPFDLADALREGATMLLDRAQSAGVRIAIDLPRSGPWFEGDRRLTVQVVINIVGNAVKFTPSGGSIVLSGATEADGSYRATVRDDGPGMTAEELRRVLDPYEQGDARLSRQHAGSGLGLGISRRIMEAQGGSLEIASEPGKGTTASCRFPAARLRPA